jgi:hypothetical protein
LNILLAIVKKSMYFIAFFILMFSIVLLMIIQLLHLCLSPHLLAQEMIL